MAKRVGEKLQQRAAEVGHEIKEMADKAANATRDATKRFAHEMAETRAKAEHRLHDLAEKAGDKRKRH
jgi:hypothetical protein